MKANRVHQDFSVKHLNINEQRERTDMFQMPPVATGAALILFFKDAGWNSVLLRGTPK